MLLLVPANACLSSPLENNYSAEQDSFYVLVNDEKQLGLRLLAVKVHLNLKKASCASFITNQWKTKFNTKAVISNYCWPNLACTTANATSGFTKRPLKKACNKAP